jgi:hypothetical protein
MRARCACCQRVSPLGVLQSTWCCSLGFPPCGPCPRPSASGVMVGSVEVWDPERDTLEYAEVGLRTSCPLSVLLNGTLVVNASLGWLDHEAHPTCTLVVRACEATTVERWCGLVAVVVVVSVSDVNEPPVFTSGPSLQLAVSEDTAVGSTLAVVPCTDSDADDRVEIAVMAPEGDPMPPPVLAVLRNGSLVLMALLDAGVATTHTLRVRCTDTGGLFAEVVVTVNVVGEADPPLLWCASPSAVASIAEHTVDVVVPLPVFVVTMRAHGTTTVAVAQSGNVAMNAWPVLQLRPGHLSTAAHIQHFSVGLAVSGYMPPGTHLLPLFATDDTTGASSPTCNVTLVVLNVNDPPSFVGFPAAVDVIVSEDAPAGETIAVVGFTDPDAGLGQQLVCVLGPAFCVGRTPATDVPLFTVVTDAGFTACTVTLAAPLLDFEVCRGYNLTLAVSDGTLEASTALNILVADVSDVPTVLAVVAASGSSVLAAATFSLSLTGHVVTNASGLPAASPVPDMSSLGGDVLVVTGLHLGSPAPGGFRHSAAAGVELDYWDGNSTNATVLRTSRCVVAAGGSGLPGVLHCATVPGAGPVSMVGLRVGLQAAPPFPVRLEHRAPVVDQIRPSLLSTAGGTEVTVVGSGFGPIGTSLRRTVWLGPVALSNCRVGAADTALVCMTPSSPAIVGSLTPVVIVGDAGRPSPLVRFRAPCLLSVSVVSSVDGRMSTRGGDRVVLVGRNLGRAGSVPDYVAYGAGLGVLLEGVVDNDTTPARVPDGFIIPGRSQAGAPAAGNSSSPMPLYFAVSCSVVVANEQVECKTAPGVGGGHIWSLSTRGAASTLCMGAAGIASISTSYGAPVVAALVAAAWDTPGRGLQTEGGSVVTVVGANFGPPGAARLLLAGVPMTSFAAHNDTTGVFVAPAGVGTALPVTLLVGGQWSAVRPNAMLSYDSPALRTAVVMDGACLCVCGHLRACMVFAVRSG